MRKSLAGAMVSLHCQYRILKDSLTVEDFNEVQLPLTGHIPGPQMGDSMHVRSGDPLHNHLAMRLGAWGGKEVTCFLCHM